MSNDPVPRYVRRFREHFGFAGVSPVMTTGNLRAALFTFALAAFATTAAAAPARKVTYEPPLPAGTASANLLKGAKTTASGSWEKQAPDKAVDGDRSSASHWAAENLPVWHRVELAAPTEMSAVRVLPFREDGRIYQYKVEGSVDGATWFMLGDKTANSIAAGPEGDLFEFAPRPVKFLRTTFLKNSRGAQNGGHLVEIEAYAGPVSSALAGGIGDTDTRYAPSGALALAPVSSGVKLSGWRGERVNAQVVLTAAGAQREVRLGSAGLRSASGGVVPVTLNFVRYTLADNKPQGDILDDAAALDLAAGTNRPVWVAVDIPRNAAPGKYSGEVVAKSFSGEVRFPVSLEVLPATLPEPRDWKCHLDIWQHPDAVARRHDVPMWSPEHFALMKPLMRRLADAGQKTITCTLIDEPWGGQTYDKFGSMVEWRRKADGTWSYDYSVFDRWVEFMSKECGYDRARIHCYTMIPWSLKFGYFDEKRGAHDALSLRPGSPEYEAHWGAFLKDFAAHLKSKGWLDRAVIGIDERPDALLRPALAVMKKYAPSLKIASAINHPSGITRDMDDISPIIGATSDFDLAGLDARRAAGKLTTYYVCTAPAVPNTFTFSPPAESEWLGLFAAARGYDGFLRWAYNSWVEDPLRSTDFTSWPSGDCFLVYPGNRSSIRFERLRDGIEGFEKVRLLREAAAKNGSPAARAVMAKLDTALAPFTLKRAGDSGVHAGDVRAANAAIEDAARTLRP